MAKKIEEILKSPAFTFIIGPKKTRFAVHSAVIARQSHPLHALINDRMAEAVSRTTVLEDVDCTTFVRFCQFAYFGDYEPVAPREGQAVVKANLDVDKRQERYKSEKRRRHTPMRNTAPPLSWCWAPKPKKIGPLNKRPTSKRITTRKRTKRHKGDYGFNKPVQQPAPRVVLLEKFKSRTYSTGSSWKPFLGRCEPTSNKSDKEDFTPVLLGYAHLCTFADTWYTPGPRDLTLYKLHKTLANFNMSSASVDAAVALIHYTYDNENTPELVGIDPLRELVASFAACQDDTLLRAPKFVEVVGEGGQFTEALREMMKRRGVGRTEGKEEKRDRRSAEEDISEDEDEDRPRRGRYARRDYTNEEMDS